MSDLRDRLDVLRELLEDETPSTQEDLRDKLEKAGYDVTQSTISRDLRKLGAVRATDAEGRTVYRLSQESEPPVAAGNFGDLVKDVMTNGSLIVVHTVIGSAPLIARHLDRVRPGGILGTIAGDDTIFVAPRSSSRRATQEALKAITQSLSGA